MARPREFEPHEALDDIMSVFWRQGYEGTSLQDIEAATGLNKQSLYRVFKDKRAMYRAALRRYDETEVRETAELLSRPGDARRKFQRLFDSVVAEAAPGAERRGCFLCNAGADQAQADPETRAFLKAAMGRIETSFQEALTASAPYDRNAGARKHMAAKILAAYFGLRVLVKSGAPASMLKTAARQIVSER